MATKISLAVELRRPSHFFPTGNMLAYLKNIVGSCPLFGSQMLSGSWATMDLLNVIPVDAYRPNVSSG